MYGSEAPAKKTARGGRRIRWTTQTQTKLNDNEASGGSSADYRVEKRSSTQLPKRSSVSVGKSRVPGRENESHFSANRRNSSFSLASEGSQKSGGSISYILGRIICCKCSKSKCRNTSRNSVDAENARRRRQTKIDFMSKVLQSKPWIISIYVCTIILIFGTPMQFMVFPKSMDVGFDVVYTLTFAMLVADIIMNCFVTPKYFLWSCPLCPCCDKAEEYSPEMIDSCGFCRAQMGSLMFWFDLIATITIIPSMSYVSVQYLWNSTEVVLNIDEFGNSTTSHSQEFYDARLTTFNLFVVIGRTARLARFIRASTVVSVSSKMNCCRLPKRVQKYFHRCTSAFWNNDRADNEESWIRNVVKELCCCFSCLFISDRETKRRHAAFKIQRWWRSVNSMNGQTKQMSPFLGSLAKSLTHRPKKKKKVRSETSQVGSAMRELTGKRIALGILASLIVTVAFTYTEINETEAASMLVLHIQTQNPNHSNLAIQSARSSSVPNMYQYVFANGTDALYPLENNLDPNSLREVQKITYIVNGPDEIQPDSYSTTKGYFITSIKDVMLVELVITFFIMIVWFEGVTAFASPVMTLVVIPIERMVCLLSMLRRDPLGYQSSTEFQNFMNDEDENVKKTLWNEEVLKGMETSFLMSTILRIGSLLRVGFGSAGVEIIRDNLQKGNRDGNMFNQRGQTVSCIFLFCDIRQFTDATEALQEEVFVFTNKIGAVVHEICHSYGGSANKNVGDAFLVSWPLDDTGKLKSRASDSFRGSLLGGSFAFSNKFDTCRNDQADKALLSVIKICIAFSDDSFVLDHMSELAREKLLQKLHREGNSCVRMGFGLHAGEAVQGAIGSERKLDALHIGENVELAEFLESSTKQYGLKVLMSDAFHDLLTRSTARRCRKIDQVIFNEEDDEDLGEEGEVMELFTFDIDVEALSNHKTRTNSVLSTQSGSEGGPKKRSLSFLSSPAGKVKANSYNKLKDGKGGRILNFTEALNMQFNNNESFKTRGSIINESIHETNPSHLPTTQTKADDAGQGLNLAPSAMYRPSVWTSDEMTKIRRIYTNGSFFQTFNSGLQAYFNRDWEHARKSFASILERVEDGPSRYFLNIIDESNGVPPLLFTGYRFG